MKTRHILSVRLAQRSSSARALGSLLLLSVLVCAFPGRSAAAVRTWDGSVSGSWSHPNNWSGGVAPANGDDLYFPAVAANRACTNDFANLRLNSIIFQGNGYTIRRSSGSVVTTITNGISCEQPNGGNTIALYVVLGAAQSFNILNPFSTLTVSGDIALGEHELTIEGSGNTVLSGVVSGTGALTKLGLGTLELNGAGANTYSGITRVNNGTLALGKTATPAIAGDLVVGSGTFGPDYCRLLANNQIGNTSAVTVNAAGMLDLDVYFDQIGNLIMIGGVITNRTGGNYLYLGGDVDATSVDLGTWPVPTIASAVSLGSGTQRFTVTDGPGEIDLEISGTVVGTATLQKLEAGTLRLAASNNYSGLTIVAAGLLKIADDDSLGGVGAGTLVSSGASLYAEFGVNAIQEPLTLGGTGIAAAGALQIEGGLTWTAPVTLTSDARVRCIPSSIYTAVIEGVIGGTGSFAKAGPADLQLAGASGNTLSGDIVVEEGVLLMNKSAGLCAPHWLVVWNAEARHLSPFEVERVRVNQGGLWNLNGHNDGVVELELNEGGDVSTGAGLLNFGGTNPRVQTRPGMLLGAQSTIAGSVQIGSATTFDVASAGNPMGDTAELILSAVVSGTQSITKIGSGDLLLTGNNTFTGSVVVNDGELRLGHSAALGTTAGGVTVNNAAVLLISGDIAVGNEPLTLNSTGETGKGALYCSGGNNSWAGPVTLATDTRIGVAETASLALSGVLSGAYAVTKEYAGLLRFGGAAVNTYGGPTTILDGTLELDKVPGGAINHNAPLVIGDTNGPAGSALVRALRDSQINTATEITINPDGKLDLNNTTDSLGALTFNGGELATGTGVAQLYGNITVYGQASGRSKALGRLELPATRTISLGHGTFPVFEVQAAVGGPGGMTVTSPTGDGTMTVRGDNSYAGETRIQAGLVYLYHDNALGTTAGGTVVSNGGALVLSESRHIAGEALALSGQGVHSIGALESIYGSNVWTGPVTLAADSRVGVFRPEDALTLTGPLAGPGGLIKSRDGTLLFSGATANTYDGVTHVLNGTLLLGKTGVLAVNGTELIIGDDLGGEASAVVREISGFQIGSIPVTVNADGLLDLNNQNDTLGRVLTLNGGDVKTGAGLLTLQPNNTIAVNSSASELSGRLSVSSGSSRIDVANGKVFYLKAAVQGTANIVNAGTGYLHLTASNTFTGPVIAENGMVWVANDYALGAAGAGAVVTNLARFAIYGDIVVRDEPLVLASSTRSSIVWVPEGSNTWTGPVTLALDTEFAVDTNEFLNLFCVVSGRGGLAKSAEGTLVLGGNSLNTYTGGTRVLEGTLSLAKTIDNGAVPGTLVVGDNKGGADADRVLLGKSRQIADSSQVTVNSSGLLDLSAVSIDETIGSLAGSGHVELGDRLLKTGGNNDSTAFDGPITGSGGRIFKLGDGVFTLAGDNSYSGQTTVLGGTLLVNGLQPDSAVNVQPGNVLGGVGRAGPVTSFGTVSPGASPGVLATGDLTVNIGSTLALELNGTVPGVEHDQVDVTGAVSLGNATLKCTLGYPAHVGDSFLILRNDGIDAITGTFAGLPHGFTFNVGSVAMNINYRAGDGNDILLTVTRVSMPELRITSVTNDGPNLVLTWDGGRPPYTVESKPVLDPGLVWQVVMPPAAVSNFSLPMTPSNAFFRVLCE